MDPWATPSPWADDSGGASSSDAPAQGSSSTAPAASSSSPVRRSISPVRLALPSDTSDDPWATTGSSSTADADAVRPPSTPPRAASPVPQLPAASLSPLNERARWDDEGASAWAPSASTSAAAPAEAADEERPPSPWGGVEALPPPTAFAPARRESESSAAGGGGWTPPRRESVTEGWAPEAPPLPRWPGSEQDEQFGRAASDRSPSPSSPEVEIQVRDLDAERAAAASSSTDSETPSSAAQAAATSRFAAPFAALASWRKPATVSGAPDAARATSSIVAAEPAPSSSAVSPPRKGAKDDAGASAATTASEGPGWKHVPKKPESGLAARFSGLFSSTAGGGSAAPRVTSAAEEDEEEEEAGGAASRNAQAGAQAQMAPYGAGMLDGMRDAVPPSGGSEAEPPGGKAGDAQSQQQGGLARWLRWGRKAGAPPPSGMSEADLEWLEQLPAAPEGQAEGGSAPELDDWLADVMAARPGAGAAGGQRPMIQSTSRAGPAAAVPRIAQPPRNSALLDLADFDPISGSAIKRSQSLRSSDASGAGGARMVSSFSNDTATATPQQRSDDDFDAFTSGSSAPSAGLPRWAASQPTGASASASGGSPARATVGSGLGRGRYSARNLASLQPRRRGSYDEDEDDYGSMSPREARPAAAPYADGNAGGGAFQAYRDETPVYDVDDDVSTRPVPPPKLAPPPQPTRSSIDSVRLSAAAAGGRSGTPPIRTISPVMSSSSSTSSRTQSKVAPILPPPPPSGGARLPPPTMRAAQQQPQQQGKDVDLLDDFAEFTSASPSAAAHAAFTPPPSAGATARPPAVAALPQQARPPATTAAPTKQGGLSAADLSFFDGL